MVIFDAKTDLAVARLDGDMYESTIQALTSLYPKLSIGGYLIIDDYGHWAGQKQAVDEFFVDRPILLIPVDFGCRMAIKTA